MDLTKRIWQYVKNLGKYDSESLYDSKGNMIEVPKKNILGSENSVNKLAKVWDDCGEEIQIAMIYCMEKFNTEENASTENAKFFKKGLNELPKFLIDCQEDRMAQKEADDRLNQSNN